MDVPSEYERVGGHAVIERLVSRFYTHMDELPQAAEIRALHGDDLTPDKHKLTAFLSGWLGGPELYWQQYGHPMLRRRHLHLPIDDSAVEQWLMCMYAAVDEIIVDAELAAGLKARFKRVAGHMKNTAG